jgi:glycosyltransferase involved in cell wall biosynthesis
MLITGMLTKNEAGRYLREVLDEIISYSDGLVILDNASTDNTVTICSTYPKLLRIEIDETDFKINELHLRKKLVDLCIAEEPDWILILDADEVMEDRFKSELPEMLERGVRENIKWYSFAHYHFWASRKYYRVDKLWKPHNKAICMFRCEKGLEYFWPNKKFACGRVPISVRNYLGRETSIRIKHYGYARPEDIKKKYLWYQAQDPEGKYHQKSHLESILDKEVVLEKWKEKEEIE